jgi:hypothetical protein
MSEDYPPELLKNGDLYDFYEAIENYGFDFDDFSDNNFENFINTTFINDFIIFRKSFSIKDLNQVKFYAHKFKGLFKLILSKDISNNCEKLQMDIQKGETQINDLYITIVKDMLHFLKEFETFSEKINKPISKELLNKFYSLNNECNLNEESLLKNKLSGIEKTEAAILDSKTSNICCQMGNGQCNLM